MNVQLIDHSDVVAPLLTVAIALVVAGALFATPSVSASAAVAYGIFAGSLTLLAVLVGVIGWAAYEATREDGTARTRRVGRSGAA